MFTLCTLRSHNNRSYTVPTLRIAGVFKLLRKKSNNFLTQTPSDCFLQSRLSVYCAIKTKSLNIIQVNVRPYKFSAGVPCFVY